MTHVKMRLAGGVMILGISAAIGCSNSSPTTAAAKRPPSGMPGGFVSGEVGRFAVAQSGPDGITILDTATGELYRAAPNDVKPYSARPRGDRIIDREKDFPREFKDERIKKDELRKDEKKDGSADGKPKDKLKEDFIKDEKKDGFSKDKEK